MSKKGDKEMQTETTETITDKSAVLSYKQVHNYTDLMVARGHAEYNNGSILVKSKHPLDQLLRRGIIEQQHHDSGKRISMIRDCAFSRSSGRIYNDIGEGDSGIDAMTLYTVAQRLMPRMAGKPSRPWELITLICFTQPDIEGDYFSESDYAMMYRLAPNIQNAFEVLDKVLSDAREAIKVRIERAINHPTS